MLTNPPRSRDGNSNDGAARFGARILDLADQLAEFSESTDGLTCTFMSAAHRATAAALHALMTNAAMTAQIDVVGNVVGRYPSARPDAAALMIGSHYDTVRNAGKYDGRLGILVGIAAVEELRRRNLALPFHIDIAAFSEEEGIRFSVPYIGSSAIAGRFDAAMLDRRDSGGQSLAEVLRAAGADPTAIASIARRQKLLGYIEIHIEQGPSLLHDNLPVGIVSAIAGSMRARVKVRGVAGHAGTVPMELRHDAAAAAAEVIGLVERRCSHVSGLTGTVGQLHVPDGAINVIPGQCGFSLDIRSGDESTLASAIGDIARDMDAIAERRGVTFETEKLVETPPTACAPRMQKALATAVERQGLEVRNMVSGAGHDALMFDGVADIGMLFVRCGNNGISHSPLEAVTADDAEIATRILIEFLVNFDAAS